MSKFCYIYVKNNHLNISKYNIFREIADEEVLHLFAHSDDDHDDQLSFDEVLDHHETFVGSEATDYGDHLHNIHQFDDEL